MPLSKIHVPTSLNSDTCQLIGQELHHSLVDTCGVNPNDNFCLFTRYAKGDSIIHPTFLGNRDPDATIIVEIALLAGRTDEQKEALYKDFRSRLKEISFEPNNAVIFLIENNAIDWSFSDAGSVKSVLQLD